MKQMRNWLQRELRAREVFCIVGIAMLGFVSGGWLLLRGAPPAAELEKKGFTRLPDGTSEETLVKSWLAVDATKS